jgi:hypothetical protein
MVDTEETHKRWDPTPLFRPSSSGSQGFAVILLNQPIPPVHRKRVKEIWERGMFGFVHSDGRKRWCHVVLTEIDLL